ncbi:MAG: hypothetical protein HKN72_05670 [Gemmatimonadetes bacterium]|nr:hypothetical protein [Gemmatimonadota bacterium]NNF12687.1 hypothetical protein [Gemmatimonadota bacterium]NNL30438.1 hypothetical protein [Gemmatimonadota bacterium]
MASDTSIWYQLGHALERARHTAPTPRAVVTGDDEDNGEGSDSLTIPRPEIPSSDELMTAGIALVVDKALEGWTGRRQPGLMLLLRAAAAGAAAALLTDLIRPLLRGDAELPTMDPDTAGRILAGLGQGLVYGGVVEPRLPGPALLKGAVFGSLEYAVRPMGGLTGILGSHTPQRKIPFVGDVLDGLDGDDRAYLEHLVFGIALALIYESGPSSNGMSPDEE